MDSSVRYQAIGMLQSGKTQKEIAKRFGKGMRTIRRWWSRYLQGHRFENHSGAGRPRKMDMAIKMVLVKCLRKRHQSARILSKRLNAMGYRVCKSTVHNYLRKDIGVRAFKSPQKPLLIEKQKMNRLAFCQRVKRWTINDWKNVLWSDESPFELYHSPNTQNDRIWANNSSDVTPHETIKNPPKVMVWGMMSYNSLSDLHFVPSKQTVNAQYYVEEILEKTCLCALKRRRKTGPVHMRKMVSKRSEAHFMQDGAPSHGANVT